MLNDGLDGRSRSTDWRELVVFCVMAVALLATSDTDSTFILRASSEGPTVTLGDARPSASFLVKVSVLADNNGILSRATLGLRAAAEHTPATGTPWVTIDVFDSAGDAATSVGESTSFLRESAMEIPTSFSGQCETEQLDPNVTPCTMQFAVQFTRSVVPGVATTLTWSILGESSFWVDDGESTTYYGELPWQITVTPL
jgi:hypothetical protein